MEGRIKEVDALRGFALLGILFVNAPVIAGAYDLHNMATTIGREDRIVTWAVTFLFTTKFYLLFSFLFGYSFTLQYAAARRAGAHFTRRHMRRVAGLFIIGSFHAVLLYPGDVLTTYSVLGLFLFTVRHLRDRTALRSAIALVTGLALSFFLIAYVALETPVHSGTTQSTLFHSNLMAYQGRPEDIIRANVHEFREALGGAALYAGHLFSAFLVGLAAGKRAMFRNIAHYQPHLKRAVLFGLLIGLPGNAFMAACENGPLDGRYFYLGRAVGIIASPAMTAAYAAALLLFLNTAPGRWIGEYLAAAGRMALTNYLAQSLVLSFLFTGYGLALYGCVGPAELALWCAVLYGAQLVTSKWLMHRARYGPAELVLRGITGVAVRDVGVRR